MTHVLAVELAPFNDQHRGQFDFQNRVYATYGRGVDLARLQCGGHGLANAVQRRQLSALAVELLFQLLGAQDGLDPRQQLLHVVGFGNVVVGPGGEGLHFFVVAGRGCQQHDAGIAQVGMAANPIQHLQPRQARHAHVQ